jgi:uncharacterized membrane protein HdeD (DUF308 family)
MRPEGEPVIGLRTALLLYGVLVILALVTLKDTARTLTLLIVGALVAKSIVHYYRDRME